MKDEKVLTVFGWCKKKYMKPVFVDIKKWTKLMKEALEKYYKNGKEKKQ